MLKIKIDTAATEQPKIIKGCPSDRWEDVEASQHSPFIYISSNGSRWAGEDPGDVDELLKMLATHPLDRSFEKYGDFITENPCQGVRSEDGTDWVDGPRFFEAETTSFSGNFLTYSHVFNIYTNHPETIEALTKAIRANQERADYKAQKLEAA